MFQRVVITRLVNGAKVETFNLHHVTARHDILPVEPPSVLLPRRGFAAWPPGAPPPDSVGFVIANETRDTRLRTAVFWGLGSQVMQPGPMMEMIIRAAEVPFIAQALADAAVDGAQRPLPCAPLTERQN